MTNTIDLSLAENETLNKAFTLRSGTAESSVPYDLTGVDFEAEIRDQRGALILRLTSSEGDGGIVITDAANGVFAFHAPQGTLTYQANRSLRYDLLMQVDGNLRNLWSGSVRVTQGVTVP